MEVHHIVQIIDTRANLQSSLDARQIAIETDNNENLVYKDDDGTYHIVANQNEALTFTDINCDDLTVSTGHYLLITDMTVGSILFAGTSGAISQDNANFFWDNSNKRQGIGTAAPECPLDIYQGSAGSISPIAGTLLKIEDDASAYLSFLVPNASTCGVYFGLVGGGFGNNSYSILANASDLTIQSTGDGGIKIISNASHEITLSCDTTSMHIDNTEIHLITGNVAVGTQSGKRFSVSADSAQSLFYQSASSAANISPIILQQADLSEPMIDFYTGDLNTGDVSYTTDTHDTFHGNMKVRVRAGTNWVVKYLKTYG